MSAEQIGPVDVDVCDEEDGGNEPSLYVTVSVLNGKTQTTASVHVMGAPTDEDVAAALLKATLGSASNYSAGAWMALQRMIAEQAG